jgi:hypothetical protein
LTGIAANGGAALRWLAKATPDIDKAREILQQIVNAAHHANHVLETIRSMFKKGEDHQQTVTLDINAVVGEVLALLSGDLRRRNISVETQLLEGLPRISGNQVQLQQVLLNLLVNAADAKDTVSNRERLLRMTSQKEGPSGVLVAIDDSGPGVPPEDIERIFKPFYTTKSHGMGMGFVVRLSSCTGGGFSQLQVARADWRCTFFCRHPRTRKFRFRRRPPSGLERINMGGSPLRRASPFRRYTPSQFFFARNGAERERVTQEHQAFLARTPAVEVSKAVSSRHLDGIPPFDYAHEPFGYRDWLFEPQIEGSAIQPTLGSGAPVKAGEFILGK